MLRIILADDAAFVREAIARVLREAGVDVVAQVGDADALTAAVAVTRPDVAVIDVRMPPDFDTEGLRAAVAIRRAHPGVGVLLLSTRLETRHLVELMGEHPVGVGYLLKDRVAGVGEFVSALRQVAAGRSVVDADVVAAMIAVRRRPAALLSARELAILALMAEGRSNRGISERLVLSGRTVESHVRSIFMRLDIPEAPDDNRRVLAVLRYLRQREAGSV